MVYLQPVWTLHSRRASAPGPRWMPRAAPDPECAGRHPVGSSRRNANQAAARGAGRPSCDVVDACVDTAAGDVARSLARKLGNATLARHGDKPIAAARMGIETNSHMCGTAVMGEDPGRSVMDRDCRAREVGNLWLLDSSGFPSSVGLNPALTIAANALRVIDTGVIDG